MSIKKTSIFLFISLILFSNIILASSFNQYIGIHQINNYSCIYKECPEEIGESIQITDSHILIGEYRFRIKPYSEDLGEAHWNKGYFDETQDEKIIFKERGFYRHSNYELTPTSDGFTLYISYRTSFWHEPGFDFTLRL